MRYVSTLCALALCACGGDDSPNQLEVAGPVASTVYGITFNEAGGLHDGHLVTADNSFIYAATSRLGFGSWTYTASESVAAILVLDRVRDQDGQPFPAAKGRGATVQVRLEQSSNGVWAGEGALMYPTAKTTPPISALPRNWHMRRSYRFPEPAFNSYTAHIDIDSAGTLSGFDTNDCQFRGALTARPAGQPFYDVRINASLCGATDFFIENVEYTGHAYVIEKNTGGVSLHIIAVNRIASRGISFDLSVR